MKTSMVKSWEEIPSSLNDGADIVVLIQEIVWTKLWVIICKHEFAEYVETAFRDFKIAKGLPYGPQDLPRFIVITHDQSPGKIAEKILPVAKQLSEQIFQELSKAEKLGDETSGVS